MFLFRKKCNDVENYDDLLTPRNRNLLGKNLPCSQDWFKAKYYTICSWKSKFTSPHKIQMNITFLWIFLIMIIKRNSIVM